MMRGGGYPAGYFADFSWRLTPEELIADGNIGSKPPRRLDRGAGCGWSLAAKCAGTRPFIGRVEGSRRKIANGCVFAGIRTRIFCRAGDQAIPYQTPGD
jgi:hypothetical protein